MAINNFIPTIWAARLLENLQNTLVFGQPQIMGSDYEGLITAQGDTVKINSIGAVTIGDYTKNGTIGAAEELQDATRILKIDQAKFFNFKIDDIDKIQQNPKLMDAAMKEAAYGLANVADQFFASQYVDAAAENLIGSDTAPITVTKESAYDYLVDLSTKLDEANVPADDRFVVVPPFYEGLLLKDARFVAAGTTTSDDRLMNGLIGRAAGFNIFKSNNAPKVAADADNNVVENYKVIAGHPIAWTKAEQISQVEAYRPENSFSDAVKGLHLYGSSVIRDTALAVLSTTRPS